VLVPPRAAIFERCRTMRAMIHAIHETWRH
jgi:hypothetical protein